MPTARLWFEITAQPGAQTRSGLNPVSSSNSYPWARSGALNLPDCAPRISTVNTRNQESWPEIGPDGVYGRHKVWIPGVGSNHDSRLQRPVSYHWTTGDQAGGRPLQYSNTAFRGGLRCCRIANGKANPRLGKTLSFGVKHNVISNCE